MSAAPSPLDPSLYVTAPRLGVPSAVSLGIALLSAAPKPTTKAALQSDDPSRIAIARRALAPIDRLRAAQAARRSDPSAETPSPSSPADDDQSLAVTPDTPVPLVEVDSSDDA